MIKEKTKQQKRNLSIFNDMCREVDRLSLKNKANYYLIQEYTQLTPFNQDQFNVVKDDFICESCGWVDHFSKLKNNKCPDCGKKANKLIRSEFMKLVYTKKYKKPVTSFEHAKQAANDSAESNGGIWHVISIITKGFLGIKKTEYTEVSEYYFKSHPEVKSLYKVGDGELNAEYLGSLGINRRDRRKLFGKKKRIKNKKL